MCGGWRGGTLVGVGGWKGRCGGAETLVGGGWRGGTLIGVWGLEGWGSGRCGGLEGWDFGRCGGWRGGTLVGVRAGGVGLW